MSRGSYCLKLLGIQFEPSNQDNQDNNLNELLSGHETRKTINNATHPMAISLPEHEKGEGITEHDKLLLNGLEMEENTELMIQPMIISPHELGKEKKKTGQVKPMTISLPQHEKGEEITEQDKLLLNGLEMEENTEHNMIQPMIISPHELGKEEETGQDEKCGSSSHTFDNRDTVPPSSSSESDMFDNTDDDRDFIPPTEDYSSDSQDSIVFQPSTKVDSRRHSETSGKKLGNDNQAVKCDEIIKKKSRKRVRNEMQWKCNKRKKLLASGLPYISKKGKLMPAKTIKQPCNCSLKCFQKLSNEERNKIHRYYWDANKSVDVKRQFVASRVKVLKTERSRPTDGSKKRNITLKYSFLVNNEEVTVCRKMFLATLSISQTSVTNAIKKHQTGGLVSSDQRGHQEPPNKTPQAVINFVKEHISKFPKYESHYSREKTQKEYLGPHLSIKKLYLLYKEQCQQENQDPCKEWLYRKIFNTEFNLGFHFPSTDTCDTCDKFQSKLRDTKLDEDRNIIRNKYHDHLNEAKTRYHLKREDKVRAKADDGFIVLTGDLEKCLPTPHLSNTQSFYLRKLWTYNFTLHNAANNISHCFMWDESKGARGANEIASCILKWMTLHSNSSVKELTIWSDNCPGQTRNIVVAMSYAYLLHKFPALEKINHKFLLCGHTHMEVDGVHGLIERKKNSTPSMVILTPAGWQQLISSINEKIKVVNMEITDFLNFKEIFTSDKSFLVARKKNSDGEDFLISEVVHLQFRKEDSNSLFYKTSFDDVDFKKVILCRNSRRSNKTMPDTLNPTNITQLQISSKKLKDLETSLQFLPSEAHSFYRSLACQEMPDFTDDTEDSFMI